MELLQCQKTRQLDRRIWLESLSSLFGSLISKMLKGSFREFSFFCSSVKEVPAAVGETNLLDKGADTRLNCQTALQTMSKIIL